MMNTHPAFPKLQELSKQTGKNIYDLLGERLETMMKERGAETLSEGLIDLNNITMTRANAPQRISPRICTSIPTW